MKNIIVTGSSGLIATELICALIKSGKYKVYAVTGNPDKLTERYKAYDNIICCTLNELENSVLNIPFEVLINCAFARSKNGGDIAFSLDFLQELIYIVKNVDLKTFINISSQSVYGQKKKPLWTEKTPVNPDYLYAMGKYASEVIVKSNLAGTGINFTNIRLASVCENARFLNIFVKNAIEGFPIKVIGGNQICSFIDVRDVRDALIAMIEKVNNVSLADTYNLGTGETRTILELAKDVKRIYEKEYDKEVIIELEDAEISLKVGMDNTLFCKTFDWQPKLNYDAMILSLIEYNLCGGDIPIAFDIVFRNMGVK